MPETSGPRPSGWETSLSSRLQAVRAAAGRFAFHRDQHHGWRRAAAWLLVCNVLTAVAFAGYVHFHSTVYIAVAATPGRQARAAHAARRADHVRRGAQELDRLGGHGGLHPRPPRLAPQAVGHPRVLHRRGLRVLPQGPRREPVPRPAARQPAGGLGGRTRRAGDRRHPLLRGPRRLGGRVPHPGHLLGRHAPDQPGAGGAGAGDAGAARRAPRRHRHRAAHRRQATLEPETLGP